MGYVLLEIVLPLILAGLLGLAIGWMLWRWRRTKVSWTEWESTRASLADSEKRLGLLETETVDLRSKADTAESARLGLVAERDDLVAKVGGHESTLATLQADLGERDGRLKTLSAELDGSRRRAIGLEADVAAAHAKAKELELQLEDTNARIARLQGDLDVANGRAVGLQAEVAAASTLATTLRSDLEAANGRAADLQDELVARDQRLGAMEIDLREREAAVAELDGLRSDLADRERRIAELQGQAEGQAASLALLTRANLNPYGEGSHVPLVDRSAPEGYDIKGNIDSMLYHRPDSRNYGATIAEVWFDSPARAEVSGFSLSPTHPGGASASNSGGTASGIAALVEGAERHPYGDGSHGPFADRSQPDGYTIKGNVDSMLYHRPDSRSYRATIAEVWFDTPASAEAAGFALASTHPEAAGGDDIIVLAEGAELHPYGEGSHGPLAERRSAPAGFTIKGNVDSMLYHRPDSRNYGATIAEVWFIDAATAEAAGFRLSPTHPKGN